MPLRRRGRWWTLSAPSERATSLKTTDKQGQAMNCKGWLSKSINRTVRAALACLAMCLLGLPLSVSAQPKCTASPSVAAALPATIYVNPNLGTGGD